MLPQETLAKRKVTINTFSNKIQYKLKEYLNESLELTNSEINLFVKITDDNVIRKEWKLQCLLAYLMKM